MARLASGDFQDRLVKPDCQDSRDTTDTTALPVCKARLAREARGVLRGKLDRRELWARPARTVCRESPDLRELPAARDLWAGVYV